MANKPPVWAWRLRSATHGVLQAVRAGVNFRQALEAAGLRPRDIVADGRIRRCATEDKPRRRNGWFVLHPDYHGVWGDWQVGPGKLGSWQDEHAHKPDQRMAVNREHERAARKAAMQAARGAWAAAKPMRPLHPYLAGKGLSALGCTGLRQHAGQLIVPVMFRGWITSLQSIAEDGTKRFWKGAPVKAGAYVLERAHAALTVACEGLSTGLAVYQSVPQARVVVTFNCGNLLPALLAINLSGSVVIAADNDTRTQALRGFNPGLEHARKTAEVLGCGVAWPEGIEGSDFADYLTQVGDGAAKKIERLVLAKARYVIGSGGSG